MRAPNRKSRRPWLRPTWASTSARPRSARPGPAIHGATCSNHRYYDQVSTALGDGNRPEIEDYARGLDALIARVRKQVCLSGKVKPKDFKVYLVAHSMGGLVCRSFLQNEALGKAENRSAVDKVFTYATPHNGIDVKGIGNLPGFFTRNNADNFNRDRMREFLALPPDAPAVMVWYGSGMPLPRGLRGPSSIAATVATMASSTPRRATRTCPASCSGMSMSGAN